jgi:hypothetical protein
MCRKSNTNWPPRASAEGGAGTAFRLLLALALVLAPLLARPVLGWPGVAAAAIPLCAADGGMRLVPDPATPAPPPHAHCEACLAAAPALPVPAIALPHPAAHPVRAAGLAAPPIPPAAPAAPRARAPPTA